ncbi:MAG: MATE family efflux transporter [Spirochaetota bacterium]
MSKNTVEKPNLRLLLNIALPMIVSQASETMMMFVDRIFLSWLGKNHISAAMSGGLTSFVFTSFFIGIVGYVNALAGQYYGADRKVRCLQSTTQGIYLSLLFFPVLIAIIPLIKYTFILAGHTQEQINLEYSYFSMLMFGSVFILLRNALAGFFLGIGKTRIVMIANIAGMCINTPLNYILIFGKLGFPAMGIHGAALGTIGGSFCITVILLAAYVRHRIYRENTGRGIWNFNGILMKRLFRFGLPAGAEMFLNTFAFNIFILLMHSMSEDVAAAVTITFNYDMVAFIPMIGLSAAVTAMVAQQMGAGKIEGAKRATALALWTGYTYAFVMMCLFVFGADVLVRIFAGGLGPGDEKLLDLARWMLRLAAIYTLADVTQLVFAGALRGAGDTRWVMYISSILHWMMAPGAYVLIKVVEAPPTIVWIYFICFVVLLGVAIMLRFMQGRWQTITVIDEPAANMHDRTDHLHIQDY